MLVSFVPLEIKLIFFHKTSYKVLPNISIEENFQICEYYRK